MINENLSKIGEFDIWLIQWFGNGKILPFEVEQKVEIKGGAKISTELESFSLICNILRIKKTWSVSYFCPN